MRKIRNIHDVVDWGLCVGCGACLYICNKENAVALVNIYSVGIRPKFNKSICQDCIECLDVCPGFRIETRTKKYLDRSEKQDSLLIGPSYKALEGHAIERDTQYKGSSGGILSALATYCIEKENMAMVLHTGMDPEKPWQNKTVISRTKEEILKNAGSRYCTSSPCELLKEIEKSDKPCVFIGRPCDVAAVEKARKMRPELDKKLGLVLSFFCAGTPNNDATLELIEYLGVEKKEIKELNYRGQGWPGLFRVKYGTDGKNQTMTYEESWGRLHKKRPFRCHLCPDGLGELSDITSGDAWSKYVEGKKNNGLSHVLVRSKKGEELLQNAIRDKYIEAKTISRSEVIRAQGLTLRRKMLFGRLTALWIIGVPSTQFINFQLLSLWLKNSPIFMIKNIAGTVRRLLMRGLWHKNPLW